MHPILFEPGGFPVYGCGVLAAISRFAIASHRPDSRGTIAGVPGARQARAA